MKTSAKSGQVVVEYILIAAIVVGIIVGVFWRILEKQMGEIQQTLQEKMTAIIAQDDVARGIPLGWFGFDSPDTSSVRFARTGVEGAPADANADPEADEDNPDEGGSPVGSTGNPPGAKDSPNGSRGGGGSSSPPSSGQSSDPEGVDAADREDAADGEQKDALKPRKKDAETTPSSRRAKPGSDQSLGGELSEDDEELDDLSGEEEKEKKKNLKGGGSGDQQRFLFGREVKGTASGCEDADFFMLIKIFAFLGILLLVASVLVTARGQKGK